MKLKPIIPFEPVKTDIIPVGDEWVSQVKWDGVRLLTYYDGDTVRLFNRKLNERTYHYPELLNITTYCTANSVILDGEVIALGDDGKPSFPTVMRRDGIRRFEKVNDVRKHVPITYMVFDVIYYNGIWMNEQKLTDRMRRLKEIIVPSPFIQVVPSFTNSNELFEVIKAQGMEGIVIKNLNSPYFINGKNDRWQKKKNIQQIHAVVAGVTLRSGIVNSLLLGLYDEKNNLIYIGHSGTGKLKQKERIQLTTLIQPLIVNRSPFINKPERMKDSIWLKPILTVKVTFLEWLPTKRLRHPTVQAFVQVPPSKCKFETN